MDFHGFSHWKWWFSIVFCRFTSGYGHGNIHILLQLAHLSNAWSSVPHGLRIKLEWCPKYIPFIAHDITIKNPMIFPLEPHYTLLYIYIIVYQYIRIKYVPLYTSPLNPHQIPVTHFPWSNPLFSDRKKSWHPQSPRRSLLAVLHICTRLDQTLEHLDIARENGTWRQAGPHGVSSVVRIINWTIVFNGLV